MREIEQDGFITDEIYIRETKPLERVDMDKAIPARECPYPKCEECEDYVKGYCTVPMVVSKQTWMMMSDTIASLKDIIDELTETVYDEILGKPTTRSSAKDERELYDKTIIDIAGEDNAVLDI